MARERMTTESFTVGERMLPGGLAGMLISIALLASCASPAATPAPLVSPTDAPAAIPTLGTKPPAGLVLPSYFVTVTSSSNGAIGVLTTPASRCGLNVERPSGGTVDGGERVADARGIASWTYAPLSDHGESVLTVRCALGDQIEIAKARVLLP